MECVPKSKWHIPLVKVMPCICEEWHTSILLQCSTEGLEVRLWRDIPRNTCQKHTPKQADLRNIPLRQTPRFRKGILRHTRMRVRSWQHYCYIMVIWLWFWYYILGWSGNANLKGFQIQIKALLIDYMCVTFCVGMNMNVGPCICGTSNEM